MLSVVSQNIVKHWIYSWPKDIIMLVCWNVCDFSKINKINVFSFRSFHKSYFIVFLSFISHPWFVFQSFVCCHKFRVQACWDKEYAIILLSHHSIKYLAYCSLHICRSTNEIQATIRWNNKTDYMQKMKKNAVWVVLTSRHDLKKPKDSYTIVI